LIYRIFREMFLVHVINPLAQARTLCRGQVLLRRGFAPDQVSYIESGRVALGVMGTADMEHQIGVLEGPCWLDVSSVVLGLPHLVDAMADTPVQMCTVTAVEFNHAIADMPDAAREVLTDVAMAYRRQTEFAVSRLAKEAEARCAEWLLSHAHFGAKGELAVELQQRKRSIATQLGIAPETLSRVLHNLRERRLISGTGRILSLINPGALRSLAGF
jgi:CRP/FNR family transcriptional regulator, dissimilatory nitrate respiration regulator